MPKSITAAGGVVFSVTERKPAVLLIHRNAVWDIPKGKLEKGESVAMCAAREVAEETGAELPIIISELGTTYHEYEQSNKQYGKTTYWYAMVFPRAQVLTPQTEEGIERIEWVDLDEAIKLVGFQNLEVVLERFKAWLG